MILVMWSLADSLSEMVTPSVLMVDVQLMSDSGGGWLARHFFFPSMITISSVLGQFSARLFFSPHLSVLSSSSYRLSTLLAGIIVSSAYLASRLPGLIGVRSAALTTKVAGPTAEPWMTPVVMIKNAEVSSPNLVCECVLQRSLPSNCRQSLGYSAESVFEEEFHIGQCRKLWRNPSKDDSVWVGRQKLCYCMQDVRLYPVTASSKQDTHLQH